MGRARHIRQSGRYAQVGRGLDKVRRRRNIALPSGFPRRGFVGLGRRLAVIGLGVMMGAGVAFGLVADSGTYDVEVADRLGFQQANLTNAIVQYIGDQNATFGSSGSGIFNSFVRVQADTTERGYNTDGPLEFDTKSGNFTHSIKVSEIPTIGIGSKDYWEFFADINDSNSTPKISLDDFELWFTTNKLITGYGVSGFPSTGTNAATKVYDFSGAIKINDVNQGSGRGDLRYLVDLAGITIPAGCNYGNPACTTYLVLYSKWGGHAADYKSDGGFEEWKVKSYPILTVSKTIVGSYTTPVTWDITKEFDETYDLFAGESTPAHEYEIDVEPSLGAPTNTQVSGVITIVNTSKVDVQATVSDIFAGAPATITGCSVAPVSGKYPIAKNGGSITCSYQQSLVAPAAGTNVATAALVVDGVTLEYTGSAAIALADYTQSFSGPTTVSVTDDFGSPGTGDDQSFGPFTTTSHDPVNYSRSWTCSTDPDDYTDGTYQIEVVNTATIDETGASDDATVTVNCYLLDVTKAADVSWVRTFEWTVEKSVTPPTAEVFENDLQNFDYEIDVTKSVAGDAYSVSGTITVSNPAPMAATLSSLTDVADGVSATTLDCGSSLVVPAGGTLECTYEVTGLPDAVGTNTATATLDVIGTTFEGTADYDAAAPTDTVNDEAEVDDVVTPDALLGVASCTGDCTWPQTVDSSDDDFAYTIQAGDPDAGSYDIDNTVTIEPVGGGTPFDSDSETVTLVVADLTVEKTADPSWELVYDWTVLKSVNPESLTIVPGATGTVTYTIDATKTLVSETFGVSGEVDVTNNATSTAAIIESVSDVIDDGSGDAPVTLDCGAAAFPYTLAAGDTLTCTYDVAVSDADGENEATAENRNRHFDSDGSVLSTLGSTDYTGTATYSLAAPSSVIDESADVADAGITCPAGFTCTLVDTGDGTGPWNFTETGSVSFDVDITAASTVPCDTYHDVPNLVTLTEVDTSETDTDDALVVVWTGECPGQGCTPGYWQGGAGSQRWNELNDPQWQGSGTNPFTHVTLFNSYFTAHPNLAGLTMYDLVSSGGTSDPVLRAARSLVAAYLNASHSGVAYPYSTDQLHGWWNEAVSGVDWAGDPDSDVFTFASLHTFLDTANNLGCPIGEPAPVATSAWLIPALGLIGFGIQRGRHRRNRR